MALNDMRLGIKGQSDVTSFNGINAPFDPGAIKACGDKVVLRKHERMHEKKYGDIVIPQTADSLIAKMCKATVLSVGPDVKDKLSVGSVVLYDHFSVFYDTHPCVVTKVENVICIVEVDDE